LGKFYVLSGEIKTIISAPHIKTAQQAACEAMLINTRTNFAEACPAPLIAVSEKGFDLTDHQQGDDFFFATVDILKKAGFNINGEDNEGENYD